MQIQTSWEFPSARILVIDDNERNVIIATELLKLAGYADIHGLRDPTEAVQTIEELKPDLILLDLHMPKVSGHEVLQMLSARKKDEPFMPILILTADTTPESRKRALDLGANDFLNKPFDGIELLLRVRNFLRMRQMHLMLNKRQDELESEVRARTKDITLARTEALECLARAVEFRDDDTGEHTKRVGEMVARLAEAMGVDDKMVDWLRMAAPLHDVGKIAVPDVILLKNGRFTPDEFDVMKEHTQSGYKIIGACTSPLLRLVREIALHHHERWDGNGYPEGLKGEDIPKSCRIVSVADVYDALTHDRPYKQAWSHEDAVEEIKKQSGKQFDPAVVEAFLKLYA